MESDKRKHLLVSLALVWLFFGLHVAVCGRRTLRLPLQRGELPILWKPFIGMVFSSSLCAFILGLAKEVADKMGIGLCPCNADTKDILANFYGIVCGAAGLSFVMVVAQLTCSHLPREVTEESVSDTICEHEDGRGPEM
jgi:hypothetical protein